MAYHLETIPVWDAYRNSAQCPLCYLHQCSEKKYVDTFLGGSVMSPDIRQTVNLDYFCPDHVQMLFHADNRLGLALMTHTHMQENMRARLLKTLDVLQKSQKTPDRTWFFKKADPYQQALDRLEKHVADQQQNCVLCTRLKPAMASYLYTLLHLYEKDSAFTQVFKSSKGFCLSHLSQVLKQAKTQLKSRILESFIKDVVQLQKENLATLTDELEWFTLKFDHRHRDKPWGNAKTALPRMINYLKGPLLPIDAEKREDSF